MPMPPIVFDVRAFGPGENAVEVEKGLHKGLEFLAQMDRTYLLANPRTKPLYQLGLRYIRDPLGTETWRGFDSLMEQGGGDCKSLAAARIAELRLQGEPAKFVLRKKTVPVGPDGNTWVVYHVQVLRSDGAVEDPSAIMGMKDAYDMGTASAPANWTPPQNLAPIMVDPQSPPAIQISGSPRARAIAHALSRRAAGLDGMSSYQIGLDGMSLYQIGGRHG